MEGGAYSDTLLRRSEVREHANRCGPTDRARQGARGAGIGESVWGDRTERHSILEATKGVKEHFEGMRMARRDFRRRYEERSLAPQGLCKESNRKTNHHEG